MAPYATHHNADDRAPGPKPQYAAQEQFSALRKTAKVEKVLAKLAECFSKAPQLVTAAKKLLADPKYFNALENVHGSWQVVAHRIGLHASQHVLNCIQVSGEWCIAAFH